MALLEDWKDATQRDTMARTISQGLTTATKPLSGNFGAPRQPDVPAADADAYKRQSAGPAAGLTVNPNSVGDTNKPAGNSAASVAAAGLTVNPFNATNTSQPGISKVSGTGLSSPLFTNIGDTGQAVSGLKGQTAGAGTQAPQRGGPESGLTITPFGGVNAANNQGGVMQNEGLDRFARANAITQELIDRQPRGGSAVLGGLDAMGRTRQEQENDAKSARWRQDDLISKAKYLPQMVGIAGAAIQGDNQQAVEGLRQKGIAAGISTQRRGQDLGYGAQMAQMGLTARGQDLNAARDNSRLGIDMARFGLEQDEAKRRAAAGESDWRVQVTPTTRSADGSTSEGSVIRYNQRTGQVEKIATGAQATPPKVGMVQDGYRYNGGNPADQRSWSKV